MTQSDKVLGLIFIIFTGFSFLIAFGVIPESFQSAFYISLPVLTASWYGAHAKDHDLEAPTSVGLILLTLFVLPIGIAFYFYKNFETQKATIMLLKAMVVGATLLSIATVSSLLVRISIT